LDSLATYLGQFAQDLLRSSDVRCRLDIPVQLPPWPLRAEIRHNLFLAFKEALNNALKHASASEVRVSMILGTHRFELTVEDNGRGFSPTTEAESRLKQVRFSSAGNGLPNMRRRIGEIGGDFELISHPDHGTRVAFGIRVPESTT
jgi:signal transduction histidine kinase